MNPDHKACGPQVDINALLLLLGLVPVFESCIIFPAD